VIADSHSSPEEKEDGRNGSIGPCVPQEEEHDRNGAEYRSRDLHWPNCGVVGGEDLQEFCERERQRHAEG
jgi:hypothetical protein